MERMKARWGVASNLQVALILLAFSLAGSLVLIVRKWVFALLGVTPDHSMWIKLPLWLAVVFPCYQVLLLGVGTLLGQGRFFWEFEKKTLRRLRILR